MRHYVGDPILLDYYLVNRSVEPPVPAAATVSIVVTPPSGAAPTVTAGNPALGHYTWTWGSTVAGVYSGVMSATGAVVDKTPFAVQVWPAVARLWLPTPKQVHALIPMRPEFTTTSNPSIDQVEDLIDLAADAVGSESTADFSTVQAGKVRYIVALHAASLVEAAFFPEQQLGPDDPARLLNERYVSELVGLRTILEGAGTDPDGSGSRAYSLPMAASPLIYDYPPEYWNAL